MRRGPRRHGTRARGRRGAGDARRFRPRRIRPCCTARVRKLRLADPNHHANRSYQSATGLAYRALAKAALIGLKPAAEAERKARGGAGRGSGRRAATIRIPHLQAVAQARPSGALAFQGSGFSGSSIGAAESAPRGRRPCQMESRRSKAEVSWYRTHATLRCRSDCPADLALAGPQTPFSVHPGWLVATDE